MDYYFFYIYIHIYRKRSTLNLEKKSICQGKFLVHAIQVTEFTHCKTVFQCISQRYVHNLKTNGNILFVPVLKILQICKFLNFTAVFTKKKTTLHTFFGGRKLISV